MDALSLKAAEQVTEPGPDRERRVQAKARVIEWTMGGPILDRLCRMVEVGTRHNTTGIYLEHVQGVYYVGSDVLGLIPYKTRYHSVAACYYLELVKQYAV